MKIELDLSLDELGRIVSLLKKWRKRHPSALLAKHLVRMTDQELALSRTNKIEAIRMVRMRTGLGLKDSKDVVEAGQ